ncbi:MAG: calcium-binding protein [Actinomycetota bacterium]
MRATAIALVGAALAATAPAAARPPARCLGRIATLVGTPGDDVLRAGPDDVVAGLGGDDVVYAHQWSGPLCGGAGDDWIRGTNPGGDEISGGDGSDLILGRAQSDLIFGGDGDDVLIGDPPGPSRREFGTAGDALYGGPGADRLYGYGDVDDLDGGDGDDYLAGGQDQDAFFPGPGDDHVRAGSDDGRDVVIFAEAPGPVTVDLAAGTVTGEGTDRLEQVESVSGTPFADHLLGSEGRDMLIGSDGGDLVQGRGGDDLLIPDMTAYRTYGVTPVEQPTDDVVDGGPGTDHAMFGPFEDPSAGMEVDLDAGRASGEGLDSLASVEGVSAGAYAGTRVIGNDEDNLVYVFGAGGSYVEGRGGDDTIAAQAGTDEVDGGPGFDTCFYAEIRRNCERGRSASRAGLVPAPRAPLRVLPAYLLPPIRPRE